MAQGEIDLGYWGLAAQPYGDPAGPLVQHSTNDPLICNSGSVGMNIADLTARFPDAVAMFTAAGFSNAEIEGRTLPTMIYNHVEAKNSGGWAGFGFQGRTNVRIPPGTFYFNSEIRSGQHRNIGSGSQLASGLRSSGTALKICETGWKSIHGAQNNGVRILMHNWTYAGEQSLTPQPLAIGLGNEYMHQTTLEQCAVFGNAQPNSFWNPLQPVEIGFMMENAGERTAVLDCQIWNMKGFPVLISKNTARPRVANCSLFYNQIAGVGMRGGALSEIIFEDLSCDNNPYVLFMFKAGSNVFNTGPFLSHAGAGVPGGVITFREVKTEAFACRGGYAGMSVCNPNFYGKGGMWAHLTGRFDFQATGGTLNVHSGSIWSAIEVSDQDRMNNFFPGAGYQGGLQLDNSTVRIKGAKFYGVRNWLADWWRQQAHTKPSLYADDDIMEFNWINKFNGTESGRSWAETPTGKFNWPITAATFRGTQPFINQNQALNWTGGTPNFNYHPVTGVNFV